MRFFKRRQLVIISVMGVLFFLALPTPPDLHHVIFYDPPCIKPHNSYHYYTCQDILVNIDDYLFKIPKHFDTDLASIPRIMWIFISPNYSKVVAPAMLHDYLYQCPQAYNRKMIDEIFYDGLVQGGVNKYTAFLMYLGVRMFGGPYFSEGRMCVDANSFEGNQNEMIEDGDVNQCEYNYL